MTEVHLLAPAGFGDPGRASGGNVYDAQLAAGLGRLGWTVVAHEVSGAWPTPGEHTRSAVEHELALVADGGVVLVDGLLATVGAPALLAHARRLRLAIVVHMPEAPGGPPAEVLRAARLVVATSHWTAGQLGGPGTQSGEGPPVVVAHPGVTPVDGHRALSPTGGSLLCVGAVTRLKGQDVLFAALGALSALGHRRWTCRCVGAVDREPGFVAGQRQVLDELQLADRVELSGPLAGSDLDAAYDEADLLVVPTRLESYGLAVVEALARGRPVVGSAVGGVPEAIGFAADGRRPGLLVDPDDPDALAGALGRWLDDPELRAELSDAARSRRSTLATWDETAGVVATALAGLAGLTGLAGLAGLVNLVGP